MKKKQSIKNEKKQSKKKQIDFFSFILILYSLVHHQDNLR